MGNDNKPSVGQTFYQMLGVDPHADDSLISLAYRHLVVAYHPDNGGMGDKVLFDRITEAWNVLCDPERRQRYDTELEKSGLYPRSDAMSQEQCTIVNHEFLQELKGKPKLSPIALEQWDSEVPLPKAPTGYSIRIACAMNPAFAGTYSRIAKDQMGRIFFGCGSGVWTFTDQGAPWEYARIKGTRDVAGLEFDDQGNLYVAIVDGTVYCLSPNKVGRVVAQLDEGLADIQIKNDHELFVTRTPDQGSSVIKLGTDGKQKELCSGYGARGLLLEPEGSIVYLTAPTGTVVRRSADGTELSSTIVSPGESFDTNKSYDGSITKDSKGNLFITAGKSGEILKLSPEGESKDFLGGLSNPTGICCDKYDSIFVLESGASRILEIARAE